MLVKLIKPIQTGVTALCLGKVSYPVFRAIYIIPAHELGTNLIFHRIRDILKQLTSSLHLIFQLFLFPRKNKWTPKLCCIYDD